MPWKKPFGVVCLVFFFYFDRIHTIRLSLRSLKWTCQYVEGVSQSRCLYGTKRKAAQGKHFTTDSIASERAAWNAAVAVRGRRSQNEARTKKRKRRRISLYSTQLNLNTTRKDIPSSGWNVSRVLSLSLCSTSPFNVAVVWSVGEDLKIRNSSSMKTKKKDSSSSSSYFSKKVGVGWSLVNCFFFVIVISWFLVPSLCRPLILPGCTHTQTRK